VIVTVDIARGTVTLDGRLAAPFVTDVRSALYDALDVVDSDLAVDMSGVELIDATGVGVLLGAHRRAQAADRRLVLRDVPERIERLLAATRLHRVFTIEQKIPV
jgi:anti-anti-sigma factor